MDNSQVREKPRERGDPGAGRDPPRDHVGHTAGRTAGGTATGHRGAGSGQHGARRCLPATADHAAPGRERLWARPLRTAPQGQPLRRRHIPGCGVWRFRTEERHGRGQRAAATAGRGCARDTRAGDTQSGDTRAGDTPAGDTPAGDTRKRQSARRAPFGGRPRSLLAASALRRSSAVR